MPEYKWADALWLENDYKVYCQSEISFDNIEECLNNYKEQNKKEVPTLIIIKK